MSVTQEASSAPATFAQQLQYGHIVHERALEKIATLQQENEGLKHDRLTSFYRKEFFEDNAKQMFEEAYLCGMPAAYFMIDIDHFKDINDTYGHKTGDKVIAHTARQLARCLRAHDSSGCESRDGDLIGRLQAEETVEIGRVGSGDEFGALVIGVTKKQAGDIAERIHTAVRENPYKTIPMTLSIGVMTTEPETVTTWEDWYQGADEALYRAKRNGRNRTEFSSHGLAAVPHPWADEAIIGSDHSSSAA